MEDAPGAWSWGCGSSRGRLRGRSFSQSIRGRGSFLPFPSVPRHPGIRAKKVWRRPSASHSTPQPHSPVLFSRSTGDPDALWVKGSLLSPSPGWRIQIWGAEAPLHSSTVPGTEDGSGLAGHGHSMFPSSLSRGFAVAFHASPRGFLLCSRGCSRCGAPPNPRSCKRLPRGSGRRMLRGSDTDTGDPGSNEPGYSHPCTGFWEGLGAQSWIPITE